LNLPLDISPKVDSALKSGAPVVALESSIISHGLPCPDNIELAVETERLIETSGACPATIAVMDGRIRIGLNLDELEKLSSGDDIAKLSRSDIPVALAKGLTGSTTVASTMICSRLAGIEVFATGGIGGAHRGAELSFDVSADLTELANSPVIVVSSGAKAILDIPKTLEILETLGVPVIAFGQSAFPAFWSRTSGFDAPHRLDSTREIAAAFHFMRELNLPGGLLIANPVPEGSELPLPEVNRWIDRALLDLERNTMHGKAVTPFLLDRIVGLSGGLSLKANKELVKGNAALAARIARSLVRFRASISAARRKF